MPFVFKGLLSACIKRFIVDTLLVILSYYVLEVLGKLNIKEK
jgi:hypothetical protein